MTDTKSSTDIGIHHESDVPAVYDADVLNVTIKGEKGMSEEKETYNATPNLETDWRIEAEIIVLKLGTMNYFPACDWLTDQLKHLVTLDRLRESIKSMEAQNAVSAQVLADWADGLEDRAALEARYSAESEQMDVQPS